MRKMYLLFKLDGMPPQVFFIVQINNEFKVTCYSRSQLIPTRKLVGKFSGKLETYDQLHAIISMLDTLQPDLNSELISTIRLLRELSNILDVKNTKSTRISFTCDQLVLNAAENHGRRYSGDFIGEAISLYLKSSSCYDAFRYVLVLPHRDTVKSFFGKLGSPGSLSECSTVGHKVMSTFNDAMERHCKGSNRPGFSETLPVWALLSRCPDFVDICPGET